MSKFLIFLLSLFLAQPAIAHGSQGAVSIKSVKKAKAIHVFPLTLGGTFGPNGHPAYSMNNRWRLGYGLRMPSGWAFTVDGALGEAGMESAAYNGSEHDMDWKGRHLHVAAGIPIKTWDTKVNVQIGTDSDSLYVFYFDKEVTAWRVLGLHASYTRSSYLGEEWNGEPLLDLQDKVFMLGARYHGYHGVTIRYEKDGSHRRTHYGETQIALGPTWGPQGDRLGVKLEAYTTNEFLSLPYYLGMAFHYQLHLDHQELDDFVGIVDAEDVDRRASFRFTLDAGVALRFMGS